MLPSINVAHHFPELHRKLVELLRALDAREWDLPTVAPAWTVKDVAAHLLDTQQRLVARIRGEPPPPSPEIRSAADLTAFINALNAEGVHRYRRLDPPALIAMLEDGAADFARHHQSLDPFAAAMFPVSWAGESTSPNWFHTAREFTERWHHQQQIRLATDRPGIMTPDLYHPVLDCFMRALPFTYRDVARPPGTVARVTVAGGCGGSWHLLRDRGRLAARRRAGAARGRRGDDPAGDRLADLHERDDPRGRRAASAHQRRRRAREPRPRDDRDRRLDQRNSLSSADGP